MSLQSPFRNPFKLSLRSFRMFRPGHFLSLCNRSSAAPQGLKPRIVYLQVLSFPNMTPSAIHRIPPPNPPSDYMSHATPMVKYEDDAHFDSPTSNSDMIFGPLDFDDGQQFSPELALPWDSFDSGGTQSDQLYLLGPPAPPSFGFNFPQSNNGLFGSGPYSGMSDMQSTEQSLEGNNNFNLSQWLREPECPALDNSSSPIPIRTSISVPQTPPAFHPYVEHFDFPQDASFSPSDFAALHPLPRSLSPSAFSDNSKQFPPRFHNPHDASLRPPAWASQLWDTPSRSNSRSPASPRSPAPNSPLSKTSYAMKRQSLEARTRKSSLGQVFQSSSAPSPVQSRAPNLARPYSRRAESASASDDHDATVRRKKRLTSPEASSSVDPATDTRSFFRQIPYTIY
jgi:hypothetical protein